MRPLIPRVRVGDVLRGTRNLRHYLQTASALNYVNGLARGTHGSRKSKSRLYHPSKDDEFMVTVNAWGIFGVYSARDNVVLLFVNALDRYAGIKNSLTEEDYSKRMDPTIFSKWFIRTPKKYVDLTTWSDMPYYMWVALHLNMSSVRHDTAPIFSLREGPNAPFSMGSIDNHCGSWRRSMLLQLMQQWIVRGITRPNSSWNRHMPSGGTGPRLEEIPQMHREIKDICSNPRIAQQLKTDTTYVLQAFSQNQ